MKKFVAGILGFGILQGVLGMVAVMQLTDQNRGYLSGPWVHFAAFFLSAMVLVYVLRHDFVNFPYPHLVAFFYGVVVAVLVEAIQYYIPHRTFGLDDMLWSVAGSTV
ncbi:MAG: VanZ family protein, partial [Nanoarchaeota archaeon]